MNKEEIECIINQNQDILSSMSSNLPLDTYKRIKFVSKILETFINKSDKIYNKTGSRGLKHLLIEYNQIALYQSNEEFILCCIVAGFRTKQVVTDETHKAVYFNMDSKSINKLYNINKEFQKHPKLIRRPRGEKYNEINNEIKKNLNESILNLIIDNEEFKDLIENYTKHNYWIA
jgi:hypothetical protein